MFANCSFSGLWWPIVIQIENKRISLHLLTGRRCQRPWVPVSNGDTRLAVSQHYSRGGCGQRGRGRGVLQLPAAWLSLHVMEQRLTKPHIRTRSHILSSLTFCFLHWTLRIRVRGRANEWGCFHCELRLCLLDAKYKDEKLLFYALVIFEQGRQGPQCGM